MKPDILAIGIIRTSFGVKGWMKIFSHSGKWRHFQKLTEVIVEDKGQKTKYMVEGFKMQHGGGILKLENIDTPEQVKVMSGQQLLVPRENASVTEVDEWYVSDLTGLSVVDSSGTILGKVVSVIETCDDLLEIRRPDNRLFIIPFRKEFVGEPDLERGTIILLEEWLAEV